MSEHKRLAVVGAHTALAKALFEGLEDRDVEVAIDRYTTDAFLTEDLLPLSAFQGADLIVLAMRGQEIQAFAAKASAPILDLAQATSAPPVWPWLDRSVGAPPPAQASIVPGLIGPAAAVVRALGPLGPTSLELVLMESAAVLDQPGIDALSDEVRALFAMRELEAPLFGSRLAFGILPGLGLADGDHEAADRAISAVASAAAAVPARVTRVLVPTFSAEAAVLRIAVTEDRPLTEVGKLLREARGIQFSADEAPSTEEAMGREDALAGRLSVDPGRIGLFLCADRLSAGSTAPALLFLERWLTQG
ncbi:MAG: hypothetical protein U1E65_12045 [Myxococcota bacterium]